MKTLIIALLLIVSTTTTIVAVAEQQSGNWYQDLHRIQSLWEPALEAWFPKSSSKSASACLDKYQYPRIQKAMQIHSCHVAIGKLPGMVAKAPFSSPFSAMAQYIKTHRDNICTTLPVHVTTCFYGLTAEILEILRDDSICFPSAVLPNDYTPEELVDLIDTVIQSLCNRMDGDNKECLIHTVEKLLENTKPGDSMSKILVAFGSLMGPFRCNSNLGCCGVYYKNLAKKLRRIDNGLSSVHSKLPFVLRSLAASPCSVTSGCSRTSGMPPPSVIDNSGTLNPPQPVKPYPHFDELTPQQVHLSFGRKVDEMTVTFASVNYNGNASVQYGLRVASDDGDLDSIAQCSSESYTKSLQNITGVTVPMTYHHKCSLKNLKKDTTYYYKCINGPVISSKIHSFKTAAHNKSFSVAVIGDMGLYESFHTQKALENVRDRVDFYYDVGDIGYADNWLLHNALSFGYEGVWNRFLHYIEDFASSRPFMTVPGNHETECHSPFVCLKHPELKKGLVNYKAYNTRFAMPSNGAKSMWYSFDYGDAHFVTISTESDFPGAPHNNFTGLPVGGFGDQVAWLEQDLKTAFENRHERPWIVMTGHRPIYSVRSGKKKLTNTEKILKEWLEPLMVKYGVDLYISGHVHAYERHTPIFDNFAAMSEGSNNHLYKNPGHTAHIIHGASGNEELLTLKPASMDDVDWNFVANFDDYGIGILTVHNKTRLRWEYLSATDQSKVIDYFEIEK